MDNQNALTIIDDARKRGALVYVGQGVSQTVPLYKLEPTEIVVKPENCHTIQGKFVFRKEVCDKISDAAGISFMKADVESIRAPEEPALGLPARTIFVGRAQGKTRLPDGSWRESAPETYEFDYVAKAKAEASGDVAKEKRLAIEYYKAGPMRAATGARLRVIRQLTGMPTAFDPKDIPKDGANIVFSRIVQNTDFILSTPEGKTMAIAMATGAAEMMYGKRQQQTTAEAAPAPAADPAAGARRVGPEAEGAAASGDVFTLESEGAGPAMASEKDQIEAARNGLRDYRSIENLLGPQSRASVQAALDNPTTPLEGKLSLRFFLGQCENIYKKQVADGKRSA